MTPKSCSDGLGTFRDSAPHHHQPQGVRGERELEGREVDRQDQCEVHSEKMSVYCWTCR